MGVSQPLIIPYAYNLHPIPIVHLAQGLQNVIGLVKYATSISQDSEFRSSSFD